MSEVDGGEFGGQVSVAKGQKDGEVGGKIGGRGRTNATAAARTREICYVPREEAKIGMTRPEISSISGNSLSLSLSLSLCLSVCLSLSVSRSLSIRYSRPLHEMIIAKQCRRYILMMNIYYCVYE